MASHPMFENSFTQPGLDGFNPVLRLGDLQRYCFKASHNGLASDPLDHAQWLLNPFRNQLVLTWAAPDGRSVIDLGRHCSCE
jgi:hypothetical protein